MDMRRSFLPALVAAAAATALIPPAIAAQDGARFRVLIPYFEPRDGADHDFGEDASEELRDLINTLLTHQAMDRREIEDEADAFDVDMRDLTCYPAIQLASSLGVPVVICATYAETADRGWSVDATIRSVEGGEEFTLAPFTVARDDGDELAAQEIFGHFDRYNNQVRATAFCAEYAAGQRWEDALRQCDQSLALNPDATSTRFLRAQILRELDRNDESLDETLRVIEADPFHERALQNAGYLSAVADDDAAAREYYGRYLDINPGDVGIRMRIAYDLALAGDPVGAMDFVSVGLEVDPENADLWDQYGGFAFRAAQDAQAAYRLENPDTPDLAPLAVEYYWEATGAYENVFEVRGADTPPDRLRNVLRAYIQLEEHEVAVQAADGFLEAYPEDVQLHSLRADALHRAGRLDEAMAGLGRVLEIDPGHPTAGLRRGRLLIEARRVDEAIDALLDASRQNPGQADQAGRLVLAEGRARGYDVDDFGYMVRLTTAAKQFPNLSEELVEQLNFWHGHSLLRATIPEQEPLTLATAEATLPRFQEALQLVMASGDYATSVGLDLQVDVIQPIRTYIEIQEAIIRREGR